MPLAKGTKVKQIVSVINGVVSDAKYDADKCAFTYHVEYIDDTGEPLQNTSGRQLYILNKPLYYRSDIANCEFMVPERFITDLSSIPRLPFIYLLFNGISDTAGVLHDYLYSTGIVLRGMADAILREACLVIGVPRWKVEAIYAGVRVGGFDHYARNALVNGSSLN